MPAIAEPPTATTTTAEQAYLDLVSRVLERGVRKTNRTGTDTIAAFGEHYVVDLAEGYPLLTTKKVYFSSMLREVLWYLSGADHIRELRQHTKIWDAWADEAGDLQTAYGRFWRRFPVPASGVALGAETWADAGHPNVSPEADGSLSFDQVGYVVDELRRNPMSRRPLATRSGGRRRP
ncbi:MAG: thymidylate synthase, partial [Bacteroidota bacterium]